MKLPSDTIIDPRKVTEYLLRPLEESDKSGFLALAGYIADRCARETAETPRTVTHRIAESQRTTR